MLNDLLNIIASAAEAVQERSTEMGVESWLIPGATGGSVVAAAGYVFLKGSLATLKNYNDLIVHYKNREVELLAENASLSEMNKEYRETIHEANQHMEACRKENEQATRRIEVMATEILDLKGQIQTLSSQVHGKEKLD